MKETSSTGGAYSPAAVLPLAQIVEIARRRGFPDPELAAAIAMAESRGDPRATHDSRNRPDLPPGTMPEYSIGLWQINTIDSGGSGQPNKYATWDLTNPDTNARAAYEISSGGTKWSPGWWTTIHRGLYKPYYHPAVQPTPAPAPRIIPPLQPPTPSVALAAVAAAIMAGIAGYAAAERRRFA